MDFISAYTAVTSQPGVPQLQIEQEQIGLVLQAQEDVIKLGKSLRKKNSTAIFSTPMGYLVGTYADTMEIFRRSDVFSANGYGTRMSELTGPFMLGMDADSQYEFETSLMHLVLPASEFAAIGSWLDEYCATTTSALASQGRFDLVQDICQRVPLAFVNQFIGVPGPSDQRLMTWLHAIGAYVFEFWAPWFPGLPEAGRTAGAEFSRYLDELVRDRAALMKVDREPVPDDVLTRLLSIAALRRPGASETQLALDPVGIRRNLAGFTLGSVVGSSMAILAAIGYLLTPGNEKQRALASEAVRNGDDELLGRCMKEAYRLGEPAPPALFRTALEDVVVAAGTKRQTTIPKGSYVGIYPGMAMTDKSAIKDWKVFRLDRPASDYVMYGHGLHECFGAVIAQRTLVAVGKALLPIEGLEIAGKPTPGTGVPNELYPGSLPMAAKRSSLGTTHI